MKIKDLIRIVVSSLLRWLRLGSRRDHAPAPPPQQLDLGLDQITETGLRLRDALPIRSAEYWLQLGAPELALKELAKLPESTRRHAWSMRVQLHALHATSQYGSADEFGTERSSRHRAAMAKSSREVVP